MSILISTSVLSANGSIDNKITDFLKKNIQTPSEYKIVDVKIIKIQDLQDSANWKVYFIRLYVNLIGQNRQISMYDYVFTNGTLISKDMFSLKNGKSIKDKIIMKSNEK